MQDQFWEPASIKPRTALLTWTRIEIPSKPSKFLDKMRPLFEKKCAKNKFLVLVKKVHYLAFSVYFGNMPNFAGLWCLNHVTHRDSWGIIGKIISIAFIWYLVVLCVTASLVTIAS